MSGIAAGSRPALVKAAAVGCPTLSLRKRRKGPQTLGNK
jgi:hypothetical protein